MARRELEFWAAKAERRHGVHLTWDGPVLDVLAEGYNVAYGARSVKHEVERNVVSLLSNAHHFHGLPTGADLHLYVDYRTDGRPPQIRLRIKARGDKEFSEMTPHLVE